MTKIHAELFQCPFCSSKADIDFDYRSHSAPKENELEYWVYCTNEPVCIIHKTKSYNSREEAIKAWNTRVNKESGFVEALKEECETELKNSLFLREGQIMTYQHFLERIEQFQTKQKQVENENLFNAKSVFGIEDDDSELTRHEKLVKYLKETAKGSYQFYGRDKENNFYAGKANTALWIKETIEIFEAGKKQVKDENK